MGGKQGKAGRAACSRLRSRSVSVARIVSEFVQAAAWPFLCAEQPYRKAST